MVKIPAQVLFVILALCATSLFSWSQAKTNYPDIPRIDVHTHIAGDLDAIAKYHDLRSLLKEEHQADLAMWLNLGNGNDPLEDNIDEAMAAGKGRMLCAISDYSPHDGMKFSPSELRSWHEKGYIGFKIWYGPPHRRLESGQEGHPYVDDPANDATFAEMETIGMVGASIHVCDPNGPWGDRTKWLADPVEYWKQMLAWRHVLEKHPNLKVVNAHGMWSMCQDAQIDYLRNTLSTYPNVNVDLAATFQYFPMATPENLRSFLIEYSDRVLYGTDIGAWASDGETRENADRYMRTFQILETDQIIEKGFFGGKSIQGLNLPREALENIYHKNAMRIYPRVAEFMKDLGYPAGQ